MSWNLSKIDSESVGYIQTVLKEHYQGLLQQLIVLGDDVSHPLVYVDGVIRWECDPLVQELEKTCVINLNTRMDDAVRRKLCRALGYSLAGYADLSCVFPYCEDDDDEEETEN